MGCDYYIYSVLKIVHTGGIALIKLSEKPVYLHGTQYDDDDEDDYTIHPSNRRPQIDHLEPDVPDVLIYKKNGEVLCSEPYMPKYMELIDEYIKEQTDPEYVTTNKIIYYNSMWTHRSTGELLTNVENIDEIYIVELRAWCNAI